MAEAPMSSLEFLETVDKAPCMPSISFLMTEFLDSRIRLVLAEVTEDVGLTSISLSSSLTTTALRFGAGVTLTAIVVVGARSRDTISPLADFPLNTL
ncbi:hypothetical protein MJO29_005684 [Puccinia striiformis f. sp. tritici]|nr:hypothetical protein MJO29_005684 [Puccinia striiformis f. sp. tritici]